MAKKKRTGYQYVKFDPCAYCGGPGGTLDHIHPQSQGGINGWLNYAGSCVYCNSRKGSRSLLEFLIGKNFAEHRPRAFSKKQWLRWREEENERFVIHPLHSLLRVNYWTGLPYGD